MESSGTKLFSLAHSLSLGFAPTLRCSRTRASTLPSRDRICDCTALAKSVPPTTVTKEGFTPIVVTPLGLRNRALRRAVGVAFKSATIRLTAKEAKNLSAASGVVYTRLGAILTFLAAPNPVPTIMTGENCVRGHLGLHSYIYKALVHTLLEKSFSVRDTSPIALPPPEINGPGPAGPCNRDRGTLRLYLSRTCQGLPPSASCPLSSKAVP